MPGFPVGARWSLVGSFGLPEWPGGGAREINQAGPPLHVAPLTKPLEEGTLVEGGGDARDGQGHCSPADKRGSTGLPKCLHLEVAGAFLISLQREPVVCHAVSYCVEGEQEKAGEEAGEEAGDEGSARAWDG